MNSLIVLIKSSKGLNLLILTLNKIYKMESKVSKGKREKGGNS